MPAVTVDPELPAETHDDGPSRRKPVRRFLLTKVMPPFAAWLYRRRGRSWRYVVENEAVLQQLLADGEPIVGAFLHQRTLQLLQYFTGEDRGRWIFLASQSRDGELITRMSERLGFEVARGSSGRGGFRGLVDMIRVLRDTPGLNSGLAVDGSRGPRGVVQAGVIALAQRTRSVILPIAASTRGWVWTRSWDRAVVPRHGAEIYVKFGDPITVPSRLDASGIEALRVRLERDLLRAHTELDMRAGFQDTEPLQLDSTAPAVGASGRHTAPD